jgi:hypothetical protein
MRKFDKIKNIQMANILVEQRYLEYKGLINEEVSTDLLMNKIPFLKRFELDPDSDSNFILFTYNKKVKDVEVSNQLFKNISVHLGDYGNESNIENFNVDVDFEIVLRFDNYGGTYDVNLIPNLLINVINKNEFNIPEKFKSFYVKLIEHYEIEYPNLIKKEFSLHTQINNNNLDEKITEINELLYKLSQKLDLKFGEFKLF